MKTILYLIPHLEKGSPVTQLYGMIKYLNKEKYKAVILSFFVERENSAQPEFEKLSIKIINANLDRRELVKQRRILIKTIKEQEIDIVHSCSVLTDGICASIDFHIPLVLTLHCFVYEDVITRYGKPLGLFMCKREERAIKKATTVVTVSKTLANKYQEKINRQFLPISNGIESALWTLDEGVTKEGLRRKLNLPTEAYIVLSTNLLVSIKDPLLLINAFKEAKISNSILIMLGDGNMWDECLKYQADDIIFTGRVNNVKDYLYAADVLVSASKSEGMPYAILEAKCTGIRMILSDIPQHKEVAGEKTEVAFFPVGNREKLAEQLRLMPNGRIRYDIEMFTASFMSNKYQELYSYISKG